MTTANYTELLISPVVFTYIHTYTTTIQFMLVMYLPLFLQLLKHRCNMRSVYYCVIINSVVMLSGSLSYTGRFLV